MYKLFADSFQLVDLSPKTETIDEEIHLTCHMKLKAVMEMDDVKLLFGILDDEPKDGDNEQSDFVGPLELIPGFWHGDGSPKNEKTTISFKGLEFTELRLQAFKKVASKPEKKPFLVFENVRANGFTINPTFGRKVVLQFAVHANDDIEGDHVGRLSDGLSKAGYFILEQKDLFDKVEEAEKAERQES